MVLRWLFGLPESDEVIESETPEEADNLPWWEKVSHPDPEVRIQGHKEAQEEREAQSHYGKD